MAGSVPFRERLSREFGLLDELELDELETAKDCRVG